MSNQVGPFTFISEKNAQAYRKFLENPQELHPVTPAPVDETDIVDYLVNGLWCFTGLRHVDDSDPYKGMQFFEDCDGCTPVRFPPETSDEEIRQLCAWWIWYNANKHGGVDHVDENGKAFWNWYTNVYPEARDATKFVYGWR